MEHLPPPPPPPTATRKNHRLIIVALSVIVIVIVTGGIVAALNFSNPVNGGTVNNPQSTPLEVTTPTPTPSPTPSPTLPPTPVPTLAPEQTISISYHLERTVTLSKDLSGYPYTIEADTDKTFVTATFTVDNNGYSSFSVNPLYFQLTADNVKYDIDYNTFTVGDCDAVDVLNEGTYHGVLVFQVPAASGHATLGYNAIFKEYNIVWTQT